mgnify:CR=1 FL=1
MVLSGVSTVYLAYVGVFGLAAAGCSVGYLRARRVDDAETRRGLVGLFAGSGGWAATQVGFLVAPTPALKYAAYTLSLVVGLTTVGAWLYFCSAYTGRTFHRNRRYRRLAVGVYLSIVAVKLTNPLHELYFTTTYVTTPFAHLTIQHGTLHWVVTGLSYALVSVGFFMLYELFLEADYDTRPLTAVVGVTGLPVVLDVVGFASGRLLDINYEPLGVVLFALGVLYVFEERFLAIQVTGDVDDPVVFLDDDGRVRDANDTARETFPELVGARGDPLADVLPSVAAHDTGGGDVLERAGDGGTRDFLVSETSFALGGSDIGQVLVFKDVTTTERRRRELERQNEQLEGFAAAIRHELLNTLQVVRGRVTVAGEALEAGDAALARESFETAAETSDRMARVVEDLSTLAQYGQTLEGTTTVGFRDVVDSAWRATETGDLSLRVEGDGELAADPARLRELFESAFEFARYNGASTVTASLREDGFVVADDGEPPADTDTEAFFEYGGAVPDASVGVALPNLRTLARVHGWSTAIDSDYQEGVRVVVSGVEVVATASESTASH